MTRTRHFHLSYLNIENNQVNTRILKRHLDSLLAGTGRQHLNIHMAIDQRLQREQIVLVIINDQYTKSGIALHVSCVQPHR